MDLVLPHPRGLTDVHISGGAGAVRVHLPTGVPSRYTFSAGGGSATVGDVHRQGMPAGEVITDPAWTGAGDRVDVHLDAGIGSLIAGT